MKVEGSALPLTLQDIDTTEYYISKVDTLEFRKDCKTVTYTDTVKMVRMTVDSCKWTALTDTTWSKKIQLLLTKKEFDWFKAWLKEAMRPKDRWGWHTDDDINYAVLTYDVAPAMNYVVGDSIIPNRGQIQQLTGSVDSLTIDTLAMVKIK